MNLPRSQDYLLSGLTLRSEIPLPELIVAETSGAESDVIICLGQVPACLPGATQPGGWVDVAQDRVLVKVPGVARFLITGGQRVTVAVEPGTDPAEVRLYLLGSAFGAIYFQRGFLPLHASVVVIDGQAVVFAGDSGSGKSTMAAWLLTQGFPLLCDDVCVVRFDRHGLPLAYPAYPRIKLWQDTLTQFRIDAAGLHPDQIRVDKYHLHVPERFWIDPVPLGPVCFLRFSNDDSDPEIECIPPARGVPLIRDNTYRYQYVSGLGLTASHFEDCIRLARASRLYHFSRPRRLSALGACQALLADMLR